MSGAGEDMNPLVTITIETTDLGSDHNEIRDFIASWLDFTIEAAPFHVDGAGFEVVVRAERWDV